MDWLYQLNDKVIESPLTSGIANIAGIIILLLVVFFVYRALQKRSGSKRLK